MIWISFFTGFFIGVNAGVLLMGLVLLWARSRRHRPFPVGVETADGAGINESYQLI